MEEQKVLADIKRKSVLLFRDQSSGFTCILLWDLGTHLKSQFQVISVHFWSSSGGTQSIGMQRGRSQTGRATSMSIWNIPIVFTSVQVSEMKCGQTHSLWSSSWTPV